MLPVISHQQEITEEQNIVSNFQQQVHCLAKNIYYEAGSEPYEGKLAVAQVTMNRTRHPSFPKTVCGVVYQQVNGIYQFSWVGEKNYPIRSKTAWDDCVAIASKALTNHKIHDTIYKTKSMYFHNTSVKTGWNLKYVAKIGNHLFYTRS
jgi:spore germination cell wall hydrolase CwlJ-like protein